MAADHSPVERLNELRRLLPLLASQCVVDLSAFEQAVEEVAGRLAALSEAMLNFLEKGGGASDSDLEAALKERGRRQIAAYGAIIDAMLEAVGINEQGAMNLAAAALVDRLKQVTDERNWPAEAAEIYHEETMALLDFKNIVLQDFFDPEASRQAFRHRFRVGQEGGARTIQVYFAYAAGEFKLFAKLERHLKVSADIGHLKIWHRGLLSAGMETAEAEAKLGRSDVMTCLVSADLFEEGKTDIERAIALSVSRQLEILPVLARECIWDEGVLGQFKGNVLPANSKFVTDRFWRNLDRALAEVARGFYAAIRKLMEQETAAVLATNQDTVVSSDSGNKGRDQYGRSGQASTGVLLLRSSGQEAQGRT